MSHLYRLALFTTISIVKILTYCLLCFLSRMLRKDNITFLYTKTIIFHFFII